MKKCIFSAFVGLAAICLNPNPAAAQTDAPLAVASTPQFTTDPVEEAITDPVTGASANSKKLAASDVSSKAIRSFQQAYKNAGEASWSAIDRSFLAEFEVDGKRSKALFTKSGYMIYGITYGSESDLPKEERRTLKSNYVDFDITSVAKVYAEGGVYWISTLQNEDEIVITRSHDGAVDELQHLAKHFKTKGRKGSVVIPKQAL